MQNNVARRTCSTVAACLAILLPSAVTGRAAQPAPVPPTLEIEVLDPGVDPLGNPAVFVEPGKCGELQVNIPPVVLVHRYYYSGNRSFQAQLLPGGPSIIVANHPKTGQRCYVPVQMMPGAPRVTYTHKSIDYDYGAHGMCLVFGVCGQPTVKYRNGVPWHKKLGNMVHADDWRRKAAAAHEQCEDKVERGKLVACGAMAQVSETTGQVLLPARNLLEVMPFGKMVFATDWEARLTEKAAEYKRDHQVRHAQRAAEMRELSINTLR